MSVIHLAHAFSTKVGNSSMKLVLLKLADNANDQGECWPSRQYLAEHCEMSVRSVERYITSLERMGLLEREKRVVENIQRSNLYRLKLLAGGDTLPPGGDTPAARGGDTSAPGGATPVAHRIPIRTVNKEGKGERADEPRSAKQKAHPMPEDFHLTDQRRQKLLDKVPGLDAEDQWEQFCNYHLARDSRFVDWDRAWGTWVGNAKKYNTQNQGQEKPKPRRRM